MRGSADDTIVILAFLRILDYYYTGILFLTTNRAGALDEAFRVAHPPQDLLPAPDAASRPSRSGRSTSTASGASSGRPTTEPEACLRRRYVFTTADLFFFFFFLKKKVVVTQNVKPCFTHLSVLCCCLNQPSDIPHG